MTTARSGLSVLVADDSPPMRAHLRAIVNQEPGLYLAGEADTAAAALELFFRFRPDAVLVEVCLPDRNGFEVVQCIKQVSPECAIILLTTTPDPFVDQVGQMLAALLNWPQGTFAAKVEVADGSIAVTREVEPWPTA